MSFLKYVKKRDNKTLTIIYQVMDIGIFLEDFKYNHLQESLKRYYTYTQGNWKGTKNSSSNF